MKFDGWLTACSAEAKVILGGCGEIGSCNVSIVASK
jgi:hypothetical protein